MSVMVYTGTPGSGKSYEAMLNTIRNLKRNKFVITNFAITFTEKEKEKGLDKKYIYLPNEKITVEYLINFALENDMLKNKAEHQCIVIIDEAGGRFNCRKSSDREHKNEMREWVDFFSQHMKLGYDFILVAQNDRMIDRQIRGVIETEYKFRQINRFGMLALLPFKVFAKVEYWYTVRERVSCRFIRFKKSNIFRYDRFKMFDGFMLSEELMQKIKIIEEKKELPPLTNKNSIDNIFIEGEKE